MPSDPNVRFGVAAVVWRKTPYENALDDPQFLVLRRLGEPPAEGAGKVSIPGGWMDAGESLGDAACREVFEEVGLTCFYPGGKVVITTHESATTGMWCVTAFVHLGVLSGEPESMEPEKVGDLRWVTRGQFFRECADELFLPLHMACDKHLLDRS